MKYIFALFAMIFWTAIAGVYGKWLSEIARSSWPFVVLVGSVGTLAAMWISGAICGHPLSSLLGGLFAFVLGWGLGMAQLPYAVYGALVGWYVAKMRPEIVAAVHGVLIATSLKVLYGWGWSTAVYASIAIAFAISGSLVGRGMRICGKREREDRNLQ